MSIMHKIILGYLVAASLTTMIGSFAVIKLQDMYNQMHVAAGLNHTAIMDIARNSQVMIATITVFTVSVMAVIAIMTGKQIVLSANALREVMHRAAQGDVTARANVMTSDEIGQLALEFNHVLAKFEHTKKQT